MTQRTSKSARQQAASSVAGTRGTGASIEVESVNEEQQPRKSRKRPLLWTQLQEIARYRPLIRYLVSASLKTEHSGTFLGYIWWLLDPLLLAGIYVFVVGVVLDRGGPDFPVFVFAGVLTWKFFASGARGAIVNTVGKERLMRRVVFPRAVLPLTAVLADTIHLGFGLVVLIGFASVWGMYPHQALLFLPVIIAIEFALTLGIGFFLAAANMFLRDIRNLVLYAFRVGFYLSPGIYPVSRVPDEYERLYHLNPFATLLPAYRSVVMHHEIPDLASLGIVALASCVVMVTGYAFFVRVEPHFTKLR